MDKKTKDEALAAAAHFRKCGAAQLWLAVLPLGGDDYIVVGESRQQCADAVWAYYVKAKDDGYFQHQDYSQIKNLKELTEYLGVHIAPVQLGVVIGPGDFRDIA